MPGSAERRPPHLTRWQTRHEALRQGERDVVVGDDPGRRRDHVGDGVDRRHRGEDLPEHHELPERRGLEVGRRQDVDLGADRRPAVDLDQVPGVRSPSPGSSVWPLRHRTRSSTIVRPPTLPCQLAATPATQPAGMRPRAEVEVLGGLRVLGLAHDLVELDAEGVADQAHGVARTPPSPSRSSLEVGVVDRAAEADGELGGGRVVAGGVGRLGDGDLVDAVADAGRDDGDAGRRSRG